MMDHYDHPEDAVDAAIAAAEQVRMTQTEFRLSTGRPALVAIPEDASETEVLDFVVAVSTVIRQGAAQGRDRRPRSRILVPHG